MVINQKKNSMPPSKKASKPPVILQPPGTYVVSSYVNRYCIIKDEGFTLSLFALIDKNNTCLDEFCFSFTGNTLEVLKESLVQYSDKVGAPKNKIPQWAPAVRDLKFDYIPVVDFIHLCHWVDAHAEMCFWSYSQASTSDAASAAMAQKQTATIHPWGIALLRCDLDLQRAFLHDLYSE